MKRRVSYWIRGTQTMAGRAFTGISVFSFPSATPFLILPFHVYTAKKPLSLYTYLPFLTETLSFLYSHPIQNKCLMFLFTASSEGSSHGTQTLKGQASAYPAPSQIVVLHVTAVLLQAALCCIKLFFNMQILDKDTQSLVKSF